TWCSALTIRRGPSPALSPAGTTRRPRTWPCWRRSPGQSWCGRPTWRRSGPATCGTSSATAACCCRRSRAGRGSELWQGRLMAGSVASKVVIVTGGASGIGRAVAGRIVSDGGAVVIAGRRRDAGERAAEQLRAGGGRALFVATDVTVERDAERLAAAAVTEFGRLDGAVNNAGGVSAAGPLHTVGGGAWHAELEQDLTRVFFCLKFQIPAATRSVGRRPVLTNGSIPGG